MFDWVWLSRVVMFGFTAGATILGLVFSSQTASQPERKSPQVAANVTQPTAIKSLPPLPGKESTSKANPTPEQPKSTAPVFNLEQSLNRYTSLFATPTSLGMLAIGVAEGNYRVWSESDTLYVQQNASYFGHTDPGNLSWGEVVTNYGPCSDQGRSDGNIALAEKWCLERALSQLDVQLQDLIAAGIHPDSDLEAVLNAADLYNQAQPVHSRRFPQALMMAKRGGLQGVEALTWARTASFYLDANNNLDLEKGANQANGLIGICARQGQATTEWDCVYADQRRRVEAIANVVNQYRLLAQQQSQ